MSRTFRVPLTTQGQSPLNFPDRCICCGAPRQAESVLVINRLVQRGRQQAQVSVRYAVPHCSRCARSTRNVFLAGCIPFVLGFLAVGALAFLASVYLSDWLGLDVYGVPHSANWLVAGAFGGMIGGLIGGFVFELAARLLLLPLFGRALWQAPLLAGQFFNDSDYVAGLTARPDRAAANLFLTFTNEQIAGEFAALNTAQLTEGAG